MAKPVESSGEGYKPTSKRKRSSSKERQLAGREFEVGQNPNSRKTEDVAQPVISKSQVNSPADTPASKKQKTAAEPDSAAMAVAKTTRDVARRTVPVHTRTATTVTMMTTATSQLATEPTLTTTTTDEASEGSEHEDVLTVENIAAAFRKEINSVSMLVEEIGLFNALSLLATELLKSPDMLTRADIFSIHHLFFESTVRGESESAKDHPQDPVNPHPSYVFSSLTDCINAVENVGSFALAAQSAATAKSQCPEPEKIGFPSFGSQLPTLEQLVDASMSAQRRESWLQKFREYAAKNAAEFSLAFKTEINAEIAQQINLEARTFLEAYNRYQTAMEEHQIQLNQLCLIETKVFFPKSDNENETYILRNTQGENQWICKPYSGAHNRRFVAEAEHAASVVNFEHKFPIPLTLCVEIGETIASLQFFIKKAKNKDAVDADNLSINQTDLQKLLIFDLIFANHDRNTGNILFKSIEGECRAYGIDHDQCMFESGRGLIIEYLNLFGKELETGFDVEILHSLISAEQIGEYSNLMEKKGFSSQRMQKVANWINANQDLSKGEICSKVMDVYRGRDFF